MMLSIRYLVVSLAAWTILSEEKCVEAAAVTPQKASCLCVGFRRIQVLIRVYAEIRSYGPYLSCLSGVLSSGSKGGWSEVESSFCGDSF